MRILVVDDDKHFADSLKTELNCHFSVVDTAYCFDEAICCLLKKSYDYILQDYALGAHCGLDLVRRMKKVGFGGRFILMTGYSSKDVVIEALNIGIFKYLEKPFGLDDLLSLIPKPQNLNQTDLSVQAEGFLAIESDVKIRLTEIEYMILTFFLQNQGRLVTKEELNLHLYNGHVKSKNTIDTHMCNLKKKVITFEKRLTNLRNQGYIYRS